MTSFKAATPRENTDEGAVEEEKSVTELFLKSFKLFRYLTGEYDGETTSREYQEKIQNCIKLCEDVTNAVTSLEMFSANESLEELPTSHLKFLLLPFMLGTLWQLKIEKERRDICVASQIYFQDFVQRLFDYGIITSLPNIMEQDEEKKKKKPTLSSDQLRAYKIAKLKENKALDLKIKTLLEKQEDLNFDEETARELFLSLIQRYHNETIQELESISKELELINYSIASKKKKEDGGDDSSSGQNQPTNSSSRKADGIQTFILTRNNLEKKVFGEGYPALPVMTVEELYAQRRAEGIWGPPPNAGSGGPVLTEEQQAELEAAIKESQEETDDPVRLQQLRNMDEYKDMHRRGWGNRANRS